MRLLIVSASQRSPSQTQRVASYLAENAQQHGFEHIDLLELCQQDLPFWDGEDDHRGEQWPRIDSLVQAADALVLLTPEWGGMASPLLKNFLLMCDKQQTAHKPALLVAVVSGISGAYPISELRMNALKNNKLVAIPDHLIIRNVKQMLQAEIGNRHDQQLRERIHYSLHMLAQYSQALAPIRTAHIGTPYPKQQEYLYGM